MNFAIESLVSISSRVLNLFGMMKRRTSKRFVIGDTNDDTNYDEEAVDVIPAEIVQKFQMTLQADTDGSKDDEDEKQEQDKQLLRLPKPTLA